MALNEYALLNSDSESMASNYVFYERLKNNRSGYSYLYGKIKPTLSRYREEIGESVVDDSKVRAMAEAELAKEIRVLQDVFGTEIDASRFLAGRRLNDFKELYDGLTKAINSTLGIKEIYERNVTLIQTSKKRISPVTNKLLSGGQKSIISFYHTYLIQQIEIDLDDIAKGLEEVFNNLPPNKSLEEAAKEFLQVRLRETCKQAALRMFSPERELELQAELELGLSPEELQRQREAYQELYFALSQEDSNSSPFVQQLFDIYKVQDVIKALTEEIDSSGRIASRTRNEKGKYGIANDATFKQVGVNIHQRGGLTLEAFENFTVNTILKKTGQKGGSVSSGATGMKADNIITLEIDADRVARSLAESYQTGSGSENRAKNVQAIEKLYDDLKDVRNGFIVYSSAKNYTYNDKFGGFSAGQEQNISNFLEMMNDVSRSTRKNYKTLMGIILQLGEGAIGEKVLDKDNIENLLAQNIALFLFDDFQTLGGESPGPTAIHLMDLNGIYVPLSFILFLLADAIRFAREDVSRIRDVASVRINVSPILFPTAADQRKWEKENEATPIEAWNEQRYQAQKSTTIRAHFLKNFQQIITSFLTI